jgi:hypothetical protein
MGVRRQGQGLGEEASLRQQGQAASPGQAEATPEATLMGLLLIIIGLVLMIVGYGLIGLILLILGLVLLFAPGPWYGYGYWRGRRGPP